MRILLVLSCLLFTLFSCTEVVPAIENCELDAKNLEIEPFCSFNPKVNTSVNFPVRAQLDGVDISHEDFHILWSSDPDFGAAAISISYDNLPLELEITEKSTDCKSTAILEKSYWD